MNPESSKSPRRSLADYISEFRKYGEDIAVVDRHGYRTERWTYSRIAETASQAARELERLNVQKGERVLLWGQNCGEWVAAFYGCVLRGAIAVPLDRVASADFARRIAAQVRARVAFGSREYLGQLTGVATIPFEDLSQMLGVHLATPYVAPTLGLSDPFEILFTSGATADPKGVVLTHGNLLSNLAPIEREISKYARYERLFHPLRFMNLVPLSHGFGQFMGLWLPPLLGATVLFPETLNPAEMIRHIHRERVSVLIAVPRMIESLKDRIEREYEAIGQLPQFRAQLADSSKQKFFWRWLRFRKVHRRFGWKFWAIVSGGATLETATEEFWRRLGFVVIQGYGMTETSSLVTVNHPFSVGPGSIGKVLPGREMKLDETGEILVRGQSVAAAYWQNGEMMPVVGEDGWLRTGDLGTIDERGNLYFRGRKKNVIVTPEGMNVYPQDLENALRADPCVRDCVVVPLPREGNEVPGAVLLLRDAQCDAAAIVAKANDSLSGYQHIRQWLVWPEPDFPRTSTQKPRTNVILETALSRLGSEPAAISRSAGPVAQLVAQITQRSARTQLDDEATGRALNLSSLERVELMSAMEERFQVDLNESRFTAATTLKDLEQMLETPAVERTDFFYPRWVQRWPVTWIRSVVYYLLTWPATQLLSMPKIQGRDRLEGLRGPALVVCNHVTYLDIGFALAALPHRLRELAVAMEGERIQQMREPPKNWPWWRRLAVRAAYWSVTPLFHAFPLPQRGAFRESFRFAGESADHGYSIMVFPEGRRTTDGNIAPFQSGIGLLAADLLLPVIPMRIHGLWEAKISGHRLLAPWGSIWVHVGVPIRFPSGTRPEEITRTLEQAVRSL